MREVKLETVKEIITEPGLEDKLANVYVPFTPLGRVKALWNFTLALKDAEVESIPLIHELSQKSTDLIHLCGVHKFKFSLCKADELRTFWGWLFRNKGFLDTERAVKDYIEFVCENSVYRSGKSRRSFGLFGEFESGNRHPWRTPEWYAARQKPKVPFIPVTEFYPYIPENPTDEHALIMAVDSLVPKALQNETRADICQDMLVAIISGEVSLENLKDATPEYVRRFFKQYPSKYGHLSLDSPVANDPHGRKLGDLIAAEY